MTRHGSFLPLSREIYSADPVMFAYVLHAGTARSAARRDAGSHRSDQALSETASQPELESPETRSHVAIADALAIQSRDVRGLTEATLHQGL